MSIKSIKQAIALWKSSPNWKPSSRLFVKFTVESSSTLNFKSRVFAKANFSGEVVEGGALGLVTIGGEPPLPNPFSTTEPLVGYVQKVGPARTVLLVNEEHAIDTFKWLCFFAQDKIPSRSRLVYDGTFSLENGSHQTFSILRTADEFHTTGSSGSDDHTSLSEGDGKDPSSTTQRKKKTINRIRRVAGVATEQLKIQVTLQQEIDALRLDNEEMRQEMRAQAQQLQELKEMVRQLTSK